ncbi:hypothetical protein GE061_008640, partial [Apolygus lucorum]
ISYEALAINIWTCGAVFTPKRSADDVGFSLWRRLSSKKGLSTCFCWLPPPPTATASTTALHGPKPTSDTTRLSRPFNCVKRLGDSTDSDHGRSAQRDRTQPDPGLPTAPKKKEGTFSVRAPLTLAFGAPRLNTFIAGWLAQLHRSSVVRASQPPAKAGPSSAVNSPLLQCLCSKLPSRLTFFYAFLPPLYNVSYNPHPIILLGRYPTKPWPSISGPVVLFSPRKGAPTTLDFPFGEGCLPKRPFHVFCRRLRPQRRRRPPFTDRNPPQILQDEKPFACNICDYRAIRSSHLKRHMLAHTGEKPHVCDVCGYKTGYPSALKTHIRTHSGERPYACEVCGYRVSRFGDLKAHMRTHTGEKPYSCEFCEYKSGKLSNLKTHTRTHTGEKPYECDICEYSVGHCSALKRHMRKHHGIVAGSLKLMLGDGKPD